ncbi:alpha/beta hydrolase [Xanthomonas albilineans]|uniref:alpha/beta hydrolase n=1 Tax=Xanthomonas albilineans TaxID=29447 RepID=UPI0005F3293B|nr:alpha/beta hydrolase-fold protein [Xanthomonas albilineans]PPU92556.1 lysophospholipase [Xanthomonas albilineans]
MKPGNAAREQWRLGPGIRRQLVLLYLHGFSASPGDAGDLPEQMAQALGANLYVHRWPGHGEAAPDAMHGLTRGRLETSALEALDRACAMGDVVAIVGSSLGATLGLWLAATRPADVGAVVAWSPAVEAADPGFLDQLCAATEPLKVPGERSPTVQAYWSQWIHPDGFNALRDTLSANAADPPWSRVKCPVFLGYYRDATGAEDRTASVPAMLSMFDALGTRPQHKRALPFAAAAHAIGSPYKSQLAVAVATASVEFLNEMLPCVVKASAVQASAG